MKFGIPVPRKLAEKLVGVGIVLFIAGLAIAGLVGYIIAIVGASILLILTFFTNIKE